MIALTSTTANVTGIAGGIIVFGDPLPGSAIGIVLQAFAFALVIVAAALTPAPVRVARAGRRRGLSLSRRFVQRRDPPRAIARLRPRFSRGVPLYAMAISEPRVDTAALQDLAKRHLWMHFTRMGAYARRRGAGHRPWGGLLRLGRARQPLPRRALVALLREPRARARRPRTGRADQAKELDYFSTWSYAHPPAIELAARIASLTPGDLNRVFFTTGGGEAVESALKLAAPTTSSPATRTRRRSSRARSPTTAHRSARSRRRASRRAHAVRAARPRRLPRPEHERLPLAGGRPVAVARRGRARADPVRGARDRRRRDHGAGPERRRLLHPAGRLLPADPRDLRRVRRAADLRRGDLLLGSARRVVRRAALRLRARRHHDREGAHRRDTRRSAR